MGIFFVKALYEILDQTSTYPFPFCIVWNSCVPIKVDFFAWEAS